MPDFSTSIGNFYVCQVAICASLTWIELIQSFLEVAICWWVKQFFMILAMFLISISLHFLSIKSRRRHFVHDFRSFEHPFAQLGFTQADHPSATDLPLGGLGAHHWKVALRAFKPGHQAAHADPTAHDRPDPIPVRLRPEPWGERVGPVGAVGARKSTRNGGVFLYVLECSAVLDDDRVCL